MKLIKVLFLTMLLVGCTAIQYQEPGFAEYCTTHAGVGNCP